MALIPTLTNFKRTRAHVCFSKSNEKCFTVRCRNVTTTRYSLLYSTTKWTFTSSLFKQISVFSLSHYLTNFKRCFVLLCGKWEIEHLFIYQLLKCIFTFSRKIIYFRSLKKWFCLTSFSPTFLMFHKLYFFISLAYPTPHKECGTNSLASF